VWVTELKPNLRIHSRNYSPFYRRVIPEQINIDVIHAYRNKLLVL